MMISKSWLAAGALAVSGCAASPYYVNSSPKAFLPGQGSPQRLGERRVLPDAMLMETPVGLRRAAILETPVSVSVVGKTFALAQGDLLARATVSGTASGAIGAGAMTLCGEARADLAKNLMVASTLGISSMLNRTGASTQLCLIDADADGRAEKAILAGVKSLKDAAPVAIAPAAYRLTENAPMAGRSVAAIYYRGKTGLVGGHVSFDLAVIENGRPLMFDNVRTQVGLKTLPQRVELMGTAFTVKSYNPLDGSVVVDVERGFQESEYGLTMTTRTTYIPIYVPR